MLKLANQMLDAYDDVEKAGLRKLAALRPDCHYMSAEERASLKDSDFALSVITKKASKLNKFPVNTADNTWLSNQYFDANSYKLPKEAAATAAHHIKVACERFKIRPLPAVSQMAKEAASNAYYEGDSLPQFQKREEVDLSKFASVRDISDNYTQAQYVMKTPAHVKVASKYFSDNHKDMPLEYRHKYAAAIQRRARELGMPAEGGTVTKYASDHYSGQVDAHIRSRAGLVEFKGEEFVDHLSKLAAAKKELTPSQFAQALHAFDKKAGLVQYYGGHLQNPYNATFAAEPDPYAGMRFKTAGASLSMDELKKLAMEKHARIKEYFGSHMADGFKSDPGSIFDSLPLDAKEIMVGIANGTL